jgi:putative ABC transport system permease protein
MTRDILWALRWLRGNRWFAAVIVVILALGIGVNSAVFSIVDAVLLRPLPYHSAERLVRIDVEPSPKHWGRSILASDYRQLQGRRDVFDAVLAYRKNVVTLTDIATPDQVFCLETSAGTFSVLGAVAQLGRPLIASDDAPNAVQVVVLSDRLWRRLFHADPSITGRTITVSDHIYTVVGVMPAEFGFPSSDVEMWTPLRPDTMTTDNVSVAIMARTKPGTSLSRAQAAMEIVAKNWALRDPGNDAGVRLIVAPWRETLDRQYELSLMLVFAAVGLVLLIACSNVGSLLLGRAVQRQKEIAVRAALGAGFWRVARQLLVESLTLTLIASAAGVSAAYFALQFLVEQMAALPISIPRMDRVALNGRVLFFSVCLCLVLACLCSLAPVLLAAKTEIQQPLRGGQGSAPKRSSRLFSVLVAAQAAFSFLLLTGSGLLLRSLIRVQEADKGFRPDHVLTMRVPIGTRTLQRPGRYETRSRQSEFYREVLQRIERIPGVEAASVVNNLPLSGFNTSTVYTRPDGSMGGVATRTISPHYFTAMGTPLLQGRFFTDADRAGSPSVAIVNEYFARQLFSGRDPIGQFLPGEGNVRGAQIVGVVKNAWQGGYDRPIEAEAYLPYRQYIFGAFLSTFVIRTSGEPLGLADAIRKQVWAVDPNEPVTKVETMNDVIAVSIWRPRFSAWVFSVLGGLALLLTAAGIYGVAAYTAALRTREVGIRVALGATRARIVAGILRDAMIPLCVGLAVSIAAALVLTRVLASVLYEVSATDPLTFAASALVILTIGAAACLRPAWKASTRDPLESLKVD